MSVRSVYGIQTKPNSTVNQPATHSMLKTDSKWQKYKDFVATMTDALQNDCSTLVHFLFSCVLAALKLPSVQQKAHCGRRGVCGCYMYMYMVRG